MNNSKTDYRNGSRYNTESTGTILAIVLTVMLLIVAISVG